MVIIANNNYEDIYMTVKSLIRQKPKPCFITVILPTNSINYVKKRELIKILNITTNDYIQWRLENIQQDMTDDEMFTLVVDIERNHQYHMLLHAGIVLPDDTLTQIDNAIIDEMLQPLYIEGNTNRDGIFIPSSICRYFGAHHKAHLLDKIKLELPEESWNNQILQINQYNMIFLRNT